MDYWPGKDHNDLYVHITPILPRPARGEHLLITGRVGTTMICMFTLPHLTWANTERTFPDYWPGRGYNDLYVHITPSYLGQHGENIS